MKKILSLAVALIATLSIYAQSEIGTVSVTPKIGVTYGNYIDCIKDKKTGDWYKSKNHLGMTFGAEVAYQVNSYFQPSIALMYTNLGNVFEDEKTGKKVFEHNAHHIAMPIMANFYVWKGLALKCGVQPTLMVDCSESYAHSVCYRREWNMIDIIFPMGVSYEYKNVVFDARYNIGMNRVGRPENTFNEHLNGSKHFEHQYLQFTVGYKFDLHKKYCCATK